MAANPNTAIQNRPYRSHRVPACIRCRSRKIRCHIDIPGQPCLFCRDRGLKCQYVDFPQSTTPTEETGGALSPKKRRLSNGDASQDAGRSGSTSFHKPSGYPSASILLAPHLAEDVEILQRHISQLKTSELNSSQTYRTLLRDTRNPIVYLSVPRHRVGLTPEIGAGKEQLEIIEQIIGPFKQEVIDLYFKRIHPNFPIIDEETAVLVKKGPRDGISKNLMCVIYCMILPFWRHSEGLKMHAKPDAHYMWNKCISAVLEDFLSPSLATVCAAVLDQIGRPSVSIVGNITLSGRNVSLAQTFGLHRDCSGWELTDHEKAARMRLWWGVLITDHWNSVAYGSPPQIRRGFYDAPLPSLDSLVSSAKTSPTTRYAKTCFVHLCSLTQLLGDILSLLYHIGGDPAELAENVNRMEKMLNDLEAQLPEWFPLPNKPGSSNLWFCFLYMRLLLCRVGLRAAVSMGDKELEAIRLDQIRSSSSAVLDFVLDLGENQFRDFWLPYVTHLLVNAVNVSLRCTIEAQDAELRNASVSRLERLIVHIQHAHDNYDWDLAKYCLERCSDPVAKIASLAAREVQQPVVTNETADAQDGGNTPTLTALDDTSFLLSDLLDPNEFDFSWEALWDTPAGMTNFPV